MNRKRTALVFRCCNARDSIRRRCQPSSKKLLDQARYSSRPPEILLTHPLPESRLADARNRANQMRPMVVQSSEDFYLAKARTLGMYNSGRNQLTSDLLDEWAKGNVRQQRAAQYGRALQAMEANKYDEARKNAATVTGGRTSATHGISIWLPISILGKTKPMRQSIA